MKIPLRLLAIAFGALSLLSAGAEDWGVYKIVPVSAPKMTLEAREAGTTEGTIVTINKAANALQQQWSVVAAQDGRFGNIFASSRRISSGITVGGS